MQVEIHCPVHDKQEIIELKDGQWYFTGQVQCGNAETVGTAPGPQPIKIEIEKGTLMAVKPLELAS